MCKFFQDFGFCKFGEWCKFTHKDHKVTSKNDMEIHELKNKLQTVEKELERNGKKIMQLETNVHEMQLKIKEKEQTISKINKKYNCLREKVTLLFDLEEKVDILEKKIEKVEKAHIETVDKAAFPQVQNSKNNITPGGNEDVLRSSITIPNLVWFSRILFPDFCRQLRSAVVGWQPLVKLYGRVTHASVKFVVKLSIVSEESLPIIKLTQDALKELVEIKFL